jgi:PAS domain S-box-containing protein
LPEAAVDKNTWDFFGIKSTLGFPLSVGDGPVFGVLSFDATEKEREWPPALVNRLQLLAQVFANALARKRSEQALSESEARLRMAAAYANAGLWTLSPTTGQIWSTEKTKELFGVPPTEELDVKKFLNSVHPDDRDAVNGIIENALKSGGTTSVEYRIIQPDGQIRWISSRGRLDSGNFGEPGQLMGISIDVTEHRRAQEELQRSYAEVKELKERIQAESDYLQEEIKHIGRYDEIVGQSKALKYVLKKVEQVAHTDSVVLITGETGTGKELIARAIHNLSKRRDRVMVKVDCAALPPTLIESELFGREKGAYTGALSRQIGRFETADGSSLFLDEIGELGVEVQAKLLRIVQDGEFERLGTTKTTQVNVRLIAATHRDLAELVRNGTFREDLFYRLNVFPILVPPLRERLEDIPLLVSAFIREFEKKMGKKIRIVPSKTIDELKRYPWPGNIRELRNVIERAVIVTTGERLNLQMPKTLNAASSRTLQQAEVQHILTTLEKTGWRIKGPNGAAVILGMKPSTLYTMMHRLRIPTRQEKGGIQS